MGLGGKAETLRAALVAALPEFAREPDRLRVWAEDGVGFSRMTGTLAFGLRYRLNVLLVEVKTDLALIALPLFRWLQVNAPHLLTPGNDAFAFEVDVLDNETADVLIQLELTDQVTVQPREGGGYTLDYLPEPDPMFPDLGPPAGIDDIPDLSEVIVTAAAPPEG